MTPEVAELIQACEWFPSHYLVLSDNVFSPLLYYSYFGSAIPALVIALFVLINGHRFLANRLLFAMVAAFSAWILGALVTWATEYPSYTMFFWTLLNLFEPFVYFFAFYFFYVFIYKKDFSTGQKILFALPLIPTLLAAPTSWFLLGYDISNCDRAAVEGIISTYGYGIEILYAALIVLFAGFAFHTQKGNEERAQTVLLAVGLTAFLTSFSLGNILEVFTENWYIGQYGLFGAPVFVAFLAYLIVRFQAFNLRLIGAQVLVAALWFLTTALLFIRDINQVRLIVSITLIFVLLLGTLLVRGVFREIQARKHIEKIAADLEIANKQQITLIHFITHQIKGFVTRSRNTFSMLLEGDYGALPDTMKPMIQQGFESDTKGLSTIQEILNAANIKSGKVTYTMAPFDLKALIEEIVKDLAPAAAAKSLELKVELGNEPVMVNGDRGQLLNAYKNLIDNSIKYTPQGNVTVTLANQAGKAVFKIVDTGVGITPEDMKKLFTEGGHGAESQRVNIESTGFGLYIVKNIIETHKGRVWAESEGAGKGSQFIVELPA